MTIHAQENSKNLRAARATPLFTVFTPTFNREHTLHRAFDSLQAQTLQDFEWLVVDDGSTDNTGALMAKWQKSARFPIRCFKQDHRGKHAAHNLAIREAQGKFFLVLDSDDACVPTALDRMLHHWETIPINERSAFSGISGLCCDQHGNIVGDRYPVEPFDISLREQRYVYRLRGEKWGPELTDIIKRFPFPETAETSYMPEGLAWLQVAKSYKLRCVNEVFRIYFIDDAATGATISNGRNLRRSAAGRLPYYAWILNNDLEYFFRSPLPFLQAAVLVTVVALYAGQPLGRTFGSLHSLSAKALVLAAFPFAAGFYVFDRVRAVLAR